MAGILPLGPENMLKNHSGFLPVFKFKNRLMPLNCVLLVSYSIKMVPLSSKWWTWQILLPVCAAALLFHIVIGRAQYLLLLLLSWSIQLRSLHPVTIVRDSTIKETEWRKEMVGEASRRKDHEGIKMWGKEGLGRWN